MAIVTGPLFSQEARGQFAKSVVYTRRRGQNLARSYVIPSNPNTADQVINRDYIAAMAQVTQRIRAVQLGLTGEDDTLIDWARMRTVGAEVWPNYISRQCLGPANAQIAASVAYYDALDAGISDQWDAAAVAGTVGFVEITRPSGTVFETGKLALILQRAVRLLGYGSPFEGADETPDTFTTIP